MEDQNHGTPSVPRRVSDRYFFENIPQFFPTKEMVLSGVPTAQPSLSFLTPPPALLDDARYPPSPRRRRPAPATRSPPHASGARNPIPSPLRQIPSPLPLVPSEFQLKLGLLANGGGAPVAVVHGGAPISVVVLDLSRRRCWMHVTAELRPPSSSRVH